MSTGRLLLIRHGQTGGNRQRHLGWEDEPLDGVGVGQVRAVAALLREVPIDAVHASTLSRAVDTARPLAEQRGLAIRVREELKEIDYGRCQGMLKTEQPFKLRREHQYAPVPGGKACSMSMAASAARAMNCGWKSAPAARSRRSATTGATASSWASCQASRSRRSSSPGSTGPPTAPHMRWCSGCRRWRSNQRAGSPTKARTRQPGRPTACTGCSASRYCAPSTLTASQSAT